MTIPILTSAGCWRVMKLGQQPAACPALVMHGNRDFLLGKRFCRDSGAQLMD